MSIIIERTKSSEAGELLAYCKQIGAETNNLTYGAEGLPFTVEAEAAFLANIENSSDDIMIVAKDNGKIVGSGNLNRYPRRMNHRAEIGVSVLKSYWNQGIGRRLMETLIAFARENRVEIIDLQVRSDNVSAIHLYEKLGFEKIGTHPAFFKIDGEEVAFDYMMLQL